MKLFLNIIFILASLVFIIEGYVSIYELLLTDKKDNKIFAHIMAFLAVSLMAAIFIFYYIDWRL